MIDTAPLIAVITAAFDGVQREEGISLREGEVIDHYGSDQERAAARALDTDTRWQDVSDADLKEYGWSVPFLDAKGFRYYLPAYIMRDLRLYIDHSCHFNCSVLFDLNLLADDLRDYQLERFSLITPPQGKAICHFLEFVIEYGNEYARRDATKALDTYWNRYVHPNTE